MEAVSHVDVGIDLRRDAHGKDPDTASPTLRRFHQLLWSKPLPSGDVFHLDRASHSYLHHASRRGEFWLASDSIVQTFLYWRKFERVARQLTYSEGSTFDRLASTIGGYLVFPGQRMDGRLTINGARGLNRDIADRIDLTLECIRRHFLGEASPLDATLGRYRDFFDLFESFDGYVDFFLLRDLLEAGTAERVRFFLPFDDFQTPAVPADVESYRVFRDESMRFVIARNQRIRDDQAGGVRHGDPLIAAPAVERRRLVMGRLRSRRSRP